ncbi:MAG: hypothetical protein WCS99_18770 [Limisphaerales bacterium]
MSCFTLLSVVFGFGGGEQNAPRLPLADYVAALALALMATAILLNAILQFRAGRCCWRWGKRGSGPAMSNFAALVWVVSLSLMFFGAAFDLWSRARGNQHPASVFPKLAGWGFGAITVALAWDFWKSRKT